MTVDDVNLLTLYFSELWIVNYLFFSAHPFAKKEWYKILAPGFDKRIVTLSPCNKSAGLFNSTDSLKGRVFTLSLADCNSNKGRESENPYSHRKVKFQVEEVKGFDCYTNFYGIDITRDHACKMVKKWHSLIEGFVQAKTSDGFIVRMFAIAFTKKTPNQIKATCYLKSSHQKMIRKKMIEVMTATVQKNQLRDLVKILYVLFFFNVFRIPIDLYINIIIFIIQG